MNNDWFWNLSGTQLRSASFTDVSDGSDSEQPHTRVASAQELAGPVKAPRLSPSVQLLAARARRRQRIVIPCLPQPGLCKGPREALARVRAAEQAVWQASGGDFLKSTPPQGE